MKTPPRRIAVVVLTLLVLAGIGWWLLRASPGQGESGQLGKSVPREPVSEVVAAPAFASAVASTAGPCGKALRQAFDSHANGLLQRQDATALLAYAFSAPVQDIPDPALVGEVAYQREYRRVALERQSRADKALLRAFALAPNDREVRWLAAVYCRSDEACAAPRQALLAAEPDNLAVWLRELTWARIRNDQVGAQRAFERAAAAPRFETHLGAEQEVILAAYGDLPMPDACTTPAGRRELHMMGGRSEDEDVTMLDLALIRAHLMKFQSQPAMIDLHERCKPAVFVLADATEQGHCRKVLSRLASEGSMLERSIALSSLADNRVGGPDAARWRERLRESLWMQQAGAHPDVQSLLRPDDYMLNEVEGLRVALEAANLWPPPAGWLPKDENARNLIQTGRKPLESRR